MDILPSELLEIVQQSNLDGFKANLKKFKRYIHHPEVQELIVHNCTHTIQDIAFFDVNNGKPFALDINKLFLMRPDKARYLMNNQMV